MVAFNSSAIAADAIVLIVTSQLCLQRRPPILESRYSTYISEPFIHLLARLAKLLGTGLTTQRWITLANLAPVMGKAQEIECMRLVILPVLPVAAIRL